MARPKKNDSDKIFATHISLPKRYKPIIAEIENFSKFVQIALDQAAGIMAWDLIKKEKGYKDTEKLDDVKDEYNRAHPLNDLTKQRIKPSESSPKTPELW